ncbi:MAG TPA: septum formation initiator family protein [Gaiellaceae bacterium]
MTRLLALGGLVLVGFLYWKPMHTYLRTKEELRQRQAEVAALRVQKHRLEVRIRTSSSGEALDREARRLGLVKPGERLFIVKGINAWRAKH